MNTPRTGIKFCKPDDYVVPGSTVRTRPNGSNIPKRIVRLKFIIHKSPSAQLSGTVHHFSQSQTAASIHVYLRHYRISWTTTHLYLIDQQSYNPINSWLPVWKFDCVWNPCASARQQSDRCKMYWPGGRFPLEKTVRWIYFLKEQHKQWKYTTSRYHECYSYYTTWT